MKEKKDTREHRISFRLNDEELDFLNGFSKSTGIYRSYVLRNLIKKIRTDVPIIKTDQLLKVLASLAAEHGRDNYNKISTSCRNMLIGFFELSSLGFDASNGIIGSDPIVSYMLTLRYCQCCLS